MEMKESQASFYVNYLIPELQLKLEEIMNRESNSNPDENYSKNINILRNEITALARYDNKITLFEDIKNLTPEIFNSGLASALEDYLKKLKGYYIKVMNAAINERDRKIEELSKKLSGKDKVLLLRQNYYNDKLAEQILNKRDFDKIIQFKERLLQKAEPGFHIPESKFGRAQFFAPRKRIGDTIIGTYWFNLAVLWIFNVIFYLSLQGGVIKKGIELISNIGVNYIRPK